MQKRKSNHISEVETAIAKSADTDTDQTDTPRPPELARQERDRAV